MDTITNVHVIDCDADPCLPDKRWKIESHRKGGLIEWNQDVVNLVVPEALKKLVKVELIPNYDKWMAGSLCIDMQKLRAELESMPLLNANVLDFLLKNPHLIPVEWKNSKIVGFYGTVYLFSGPCIRYLRWRANKWDWAFVYLCRYGWEFLRANRRRCPAAVLNI